MNPLDLGLEWYVRQLKRLYEARPLYAFATLATTIAAVTTAIVLAGVVTSPSGGDTSQSPEQVTARLQEASADLRAVSDAVDEAQGTIGGLTRTVEDLESQATDLQTFLEANPKERQLMQNLASGGARPIWLDIVFLIAGILFGAVAGVVLDRFVKRIEQEPRVGRRDSEDSHP